MTATEREEWGVVPMSLAAHCQNCDLISAAPNGRCARCGSEAVAVLVIQTRRREWGKRMVETPMLRGEVSMSPDSQAAIVGARVVSEVQRAMGLHAGMHTLHEAYAVILEELDEFWDLAKVNPKRLSEAAQRDRLRNLETELIQTAAMCVRAVIDCGLGGE